MLQAISTERAPAAIGPYSQAIAVGDFLFSSGQLPIDPATGKLVEGSITEQAHFAFRNLGAIAEAAGTSLSKVVKTTIFLSNIADFQAVNAVYTEYFSTPYPARSAFQVAALPMKAGLEVEAIFRL